jgi:hypothetical protein
MLHRITTPARTIAPMTHACAKLRVLSNQKLKRIPKAARTFAPGNMNPAGG